MDWRSGEGDGMDWHLPAAQQVAQLGVQLRREKVHADERGHEGDSALGVGAGVGVGVGVGMNVATKATLR